MDEAAVRAEGLVKRYGHLEALDGIDLEVPQAPSSASWAQRGGKTTAVRVLATMLQPDAGRAQVLGHDVFSRQMRCAGGSGWRASTRRSMRT